MAPTSPSSRLGDGGGHPRATVSTHWLNYMRVANGLISVGDRETDGNGNPSGEMVCQKLYAAHGGRHKHAKNLFYI